MVLLCVPCFAQLTPGLIYNPAPGSILGAAGFIQWGPGYNDGQPGSYYIEWGTNGCFSQDIAGFKGAGSAGFIYFDAPPLPMTVTIYYYATPGHVAGVDPWDGVRCASFQGTYDGAWLPVFAGLSQYGGKVYPSLSTNRPTFTAQTTHYPYTIYAGYSTPSATNPHPNEIQDATVVSGPSFQLSVPIPFASDQPYTYITTVQGARTFNFIFNNPQGQPSSLSQISAEYTVLAIDDFTGQPTFVPTQGIPLLSDAVSKLPTNASRTEAEISQEGANYRYTYHVDTRRLTAGGCWRIPARSRPDGFQADSFG